MPVFNGEEFLAEAIASILDQDFEDLELIIADNGSTDATPQICTDAVANDPRVRHLPSTTNVGAARNFNRVVRASRGEYFAWAAHDDLRTPDFLGRCVGALDADASVSLAFGRAVDIDEAGRRIHTYPPLGYADGPSAAGRGRDILQTPSPCFEVFGLMRRSELLATGMIGPYTSSDRTLLFELALIGRFRELDDVLFLHRQHDDRSVFTHRDPRERDAWFDPTRADVMTLPRWRLVAEHVRALQRVSLPPAERARAAAHLGRWAATRADDLARDLGAWARHRVSTP